MNIRVNVEKMSNVVNELPIAYEYPVFDGAGIPITNYKLVQTEFYVNKNKENNTNDGMKVLTNNYQVIQHSFVVEQIATCLNEMNLKGQVLIKTSTDGSKMNGFVFFDDKVIKDDAKGIKVGFKFTNSYDGSGSISFSTYGCRLICANQMVLRNLCTKEIITHYGSKDFNEKIKDAISLVISQDKNFQKIIEDAMTDTFSRDQAEKIFNEFINKWFGFKRTSELLKEIGFSVVKIDDEDKTKYSFVAEEGATLKKWDIYNAITKYATHTKELSLQQEDWFQKAAEKVLMITARL